MPWLITFCSPKKNGISLTCYTIILSFEVMFMKKSWLALMAFILLVSLVVFVQKNLHSKSKKNTPAFQNGDIIFQTGNSPQCEAVKLATHSDISHCGILFQEEGAWYVLEAVEPVSVISFQQFIQRNPGSPYSVKRLKSSYLPLSDTQWNQMQAMGKSWIERHYDIYFNWSDAQLYCSELVWKLYERAVHIELCSLKELREYDLSSPMVKQIMASRYGDSIPLSEKMVAPSDLFQSDKLELVHQE
jgi:hypothetical protein